MKKRRANAVTMVSVLPRIFYIIETFVSLPELKAQGELL